MRRILARWLVLFSATSSAGCALGAGSVTRIADGREEQGRAISAEAYGAYARGALFEAAGDDHNALAAYQAALSEDADSPEIYARIGAVHCRLAQSANDKDSGAAARSLTRAVKLDPTSSTAWQETARCAARRHQAREAFAAALQAANTDPVSVESALLVVELAEAAGRATDARVWLDELVVRAPSSREAWVALAAFAVRHGDLGRELRARGGLRSLGIAPRTEATRELDAAVAGGELGAARAAAVRSRLAPGELATRLADRGHGAAASEQAALVLGADPDDANAWVARVVASDLRRDQPELERALRESPSAPSALSPLATRLYAELLERLVGPEARAAWLAAQPK
jgi:tetratricopeptide (TPR) repeat protein